MNEKLRYNAVTQRINEIKNVTLRRNLKERYLNEADSLYEKYLLYMKRHVDNDVFSQLHIDDETQTDIDKFKSILDFLSKFLRNYKRYNGELYVRLVRDEPDTILPTKAPDSAGFDLYTSEDSILNNKEVIKIPTNISICGTLLLQKYDHVGIVIGRSSTATEKNIDVKIGLIDQNFTGELKIQAKAIGDEEIKVERGNKLAQLFLVRYTPCNMKLCDNTDDNLEYLVDIIKDIAGYTRGDDGFGSTGL